LADFTMQFSSSIAFLVNPRIHDQSSDQTGYSFEYFGYRQ